MSFNITHLDDFDWREVKIDWDAMAGDVIKAGTPMSREGLIANDGNAYGILMDDVQRKRNKRGRVIVAGCVDVAKAEEHSGVKLSADAKKALADVWSQGFGGALPEGVPYAQTTEVTLVKDVTTRVNNSTYIVDGAGAPIKLEPGKKYRVIWDGVEYVRTAIDGSTPGAKIKHFISDNGEYFSDAFTISYEQSCFNGNWMEPYCMIPHDDYSAVPHTVSLYEIVEDVQKIDPRCLPDGYPYKEVTGGINIEWDGNTEGLQSVGLVGGSTAYKVSDNLPTSEQCKKSTAVMLNVSDGSTQSMNMTDEMWSSYESAGLICEHYYVLFEGLVAVILKDNLTIDSMGGVTFEKAGVYFANVGAAYVQSFTSPTTETIQPMAEEFLPAGVGGVQVVRGDIDASTGLITFGLTGNEIAELAKTSSVAVEIYYGDTLTQTLYLSCLVGGGAMANPVFIGASHNTSSITLSVISIPATSKNAPAISATLNADA